MISDSKRKLKNYACLMSKEFLQDAFLTQTTRNP